MNKSVPLKKKRTVKKKIVKKKAVKKKASKKVQPKLARGRPTSYRVEFNDQARKLCLLGATDIELADFFDVAESTIHKWKLDHLKFSESIKDGKIIADATVTESLYKRANGYSHKEDKIFNANGEPLVVPTTKHYPPDSTAIIFWLKNRQKEKWRDKVDVDANHDISDDAKEWITEIVHTHAKIDAASET